MKTIPVRSSYLRILAIRYQGARKDRLLLNEHYLLLDNQTSRKSANLNLAIFESLIQGLSYMYYLPNITDTSILTQNR